MNADVSVEVPGAVRITLELTMTLDDWEKLAKQLPMAPAASLPVYWLNETIQKATAIMRQKLRVEVPPVVQP